MFMSNVRIAARGLIKRGNKYLLLFSNTDQIYITPGGGVEEDETIIEALKRELIEEVGILVEPIKEFAVIEREMRHPIFNKAIHHYFLCEGIDYNQTMCRTNIEVEQSLELKWVSFDEVKTLFSQREGISSRFFDWYNQEEAAMNKL